MIITGATGFLGRAIIPMMIENGEELLLVGRDEQRLRALYPDANICGYETLADAAQGHEIALHLAIKNNNVWGSEEQFHQANVELLANVIDWLKKAGVKTIIYTTTLQTMSPRSGGAGRETDKTSKSFYMASKRMAEELLAKTRGIKIITLRLPAVYGDEFRGKLSILSHIPTFIRPLGFKIMASLRPCVHINQVAAEILKLAKGKQITDMILTERQKGNWVYTFFKGIIDFVFVFFVIVFLWWLLIGAWIGIKLSSPGPGIFSQQRVGKNGQNFTCYKFRTMRKGTLQAGTHETSAKNITKLGRILRKTKIDELPQIINIIKGDMSLIGPRPCLPIQIELIAERTRLGVLNEKGGITGWAQIQGVDMSEAVSLASLDAEYLDLRCVILDLKIIIATATGRGQGDKVR